MNDYNTILNRTTTYNQIKEELELFEKQKHNITQKRGFYIYGDSGIGKTRFVESLLEKNDYFLIKFNAGDVRNKGIIDNITKENMNDTSVIDMFHKRKRKIAIIMDEIDGMNSGDKGGINSLIKLIRPKKTKKQKEEITTNIPVFCIGNGRIDKKMKELMKVCYIHKLDIPNNDSIGKIIKMHWPAISIQDSNTITNYVQNDLRKLNDLYETSKHCDIFNNNTWNYLLNTKCYYEDAKEQTKLILNNKISFHQHSNTLNETDRTIISLLLHENIVEVLRKNNIEDIEFYNKLLDNFCLGDYVDRITFQKQIWQFNEMSSLIKTYYNQFLLHSQYKPKKYNPTEVRFTKVLTKYSTEYNNSIFIQTLCEKLNLDKKDMLLYFYRNINKIHEDDFIQKMSNDYEICKLDIQRIGKFVTLNYQETNHELY
jgi:hypothetical protein